MSQANIRTGKIGQGLDRFLFKTMQTLILKRPLLMAIFGLVSIQQITYHMKVRPPLRTLTTLIPPWFLMCHWVTLFKVFLPNHRDHFPRRSPGRICVFLQGQHYMTEHSSLNSGYSDRPVVLSPGEGKSMGEVLKSGDPLHPRVLTKASENYR